MNRVPINPNLLRWARERAGYSVDAVAGRFPKIKAWEGTVKLSRIRPFCGRILLDQRLRINDLAVAAGGENAAKLLNLTVSFRARIAAR